MVRVCRLALGFVVATLAWGHAVLLDGTPPSGGTVAGPDAPVRLRFNSRIDAKRSRLTLEGPGGKETVLAIAPQTAPDTLNSEMKGLKRGRCRLRWQVLASDGHITRGELVFRVE